MKSSSYLPRPRGFKHRSAGRDLCRENTIDPAANDEIAVDRFGEAMKAKLAVKREQGYGGWDDKEQCSAEHLSRLLREHVEKGDPVDVANFAMMLYQRGERIK
ncbi:hypothetical protein GGQ86_000373 [Xanthobacter flavus]|uniref:Uncharacterized protein n=1 Tax=Xanthobacter flavus TaxID=281 RepID=A0A9W6CTV7_XANFL|nr:hypothetical protein [Xanthobacter flavus]MDR6331926.1 hypothetical protein [Xanthobacter flavus]GLI25640.1 hypothetical protein XFLAVUS301_53140 [Xanthobacter flavus]